MEEKTNQSSGLTFEDLLQRIIEYLKEKENKSDSKESKENNKDSKVVDFTERKRSKEESVNTLTPFQCYQIYYPRLLSIVETKVLLIKGFSIMIMPLKVINQTFEEAFNSYKEVVMNIPQDVQVLLLDRVDVFTNLMAKMVAIKFSQQTEDINEE